MLPWQPNIIPSAEPQSDIFHEKVTFKANYPLPARHNMNNLQHILDNPYMLFKFKTK